MAKRDASMPMIRRRLHIGAWALLTWLLLTWTTSVQQLAAGVVVSVLAGWALAPVAPIAAPWSVLVPSRAWRVLAIALDCAVRIVQANVVLARRIWDPKLPIRTGMLVFPTPLRSEGAVGAVGILSSLVVDNQLVDLETGHLQYHAIWAEPSDPAHAHRRVMGRLEPLVHGLEVREPPRAG
jgi:multicomponent Na+:H+ antiporter subunit E